MNKIQSCLKPENKAKWDLFLENEKLVDEIEKDIKRTRSDIGVFREAYDSFLNTIENQPQLRRQKSMKKSELSREDNNNYIETNGDQLSRILFIYAKLNTGIKYVQGMNEILAIIYLCYRNYRDNNHYFIKEKYIESDMFHTFCNVMEDLRDGFMYELG
jgi:TBC1 domain family member 13